MNDLSPGIKPLVEALRAYGFDTLDSGDGTNYAEGMECALPYRHVYIATYDAGLDLPRLMEFMSTWKDGFEYDVGMFDPVPGEPDYLYVMEVGWEEKHDQWAGIPHDYQGDPDED